MNLVGGEYWSCIFIIPDLVSNRHIFMYIRNPWILISQFIKIYVIKIFLRNIHGLLNHFLGTPPIHLSMASLSKRQTLPILIAGILPSAAYLQMVISWSLRYFANSFVVIICGIINSLVLFKRSINWFINYYILFIILQRY